MKKEIQRAVAKGLALIMIVLTVFGNNASALFVKAAGTTYPVNIAPNEHGGFLVYKDSYEEGAGVTFVMTPAEGYTLDTYQVTNDTTSEELSTNIIGTGYVFTMPASSVTISAVFRQKGTGHLTLVTSGNGSVTATTVSGNSTLDVTDTLVLTEGNQVNILPSPDSDNVCSRN